MPGRLTLLVGSPRIAPGLFTRVAWQTLDAASVVLARDADEPLADAVTQAGLTPVSVDLTPFAVLRALAPVDELGLDVVEAEALVDIGASVTNIVVHQGGVPRFVRILLMGGADITDAVAERLGVPLDQALAAGEWPYPAERLAAAVRRGYEHLPRSQRRLPLV